MDAAVHIRRPAPLSKSVASALRQRLRREFAGGGRLPSEPEIASEYGVSRGTVRDALAVLEREGAIFRRRGSGTYANQYALRIQTHIETAYEFTDLISQAGYTASIRPVAVERGPLPDDVAERLGRDAGTDALFVSKLFLADANPAIYCLDILPADLIREPYEPAELHVPIFDFLSLRCSETIAHSLAEIVPQTVDRELAEILAVSAGEAIMRFDEVAFNRLNKPVLFYRAYYRDEYVRFSVLRKKV